MVYLAQHTAALGLLLACLWLPGYVVERRWLRVDSGLRLPARFSLGLGFWIASLFLLATVGGLHRPAFLALGLVLSGAALWTVLHHRGSAEGKARWRPSGVTLATCCGLIPILLPLYLLAMTPTVSWDANVYHLRIPKLFLAAGGFREVPFNVYSYWPLNVQLLYALAMAFQDYVLAKLLHFCFGVLTLLTLYLGCRTFHRPAAGALATAMLLANGVVIFELRIAYVDLAHAFFFLAGFLFMLATLDRRPEMLWLSGICCGLAAGAKVTGIVGAGIIGALYLPRLVRALRRGEPALRPFLVRFVAPTLGLWLPWVWRAMWTTGNPVYPFFHGLFGGPDWSTELGGRLQAWQSSIGMGREPLDYLLLPLRVILQGGAGYQRFDGQVGAFWIVVLPLALWAARRVLLVRRCLIVAGLYFVFWALSSQQTRFLIPLLPILAMAGGVAVAELFERLKSTVWRRVGLGLVFTAVLASLIPSEGHRLGAGYKTLGVFLQAKGDLKASVVPPVFRFINQKLPPRARVLLLNTNHAFFCDREVLADSFFEASQVAWWMSPATSADDLRRLMTERGITHLLIDQRNRSIAYPRALADLLNGRAFSKQIFRSPNRRLTLFEIL